MAFIIKPEALVPLFEAYKAKHFSSMHLETIPKLTQTGRVSGKTIEEKLSIPSAGIKKFTEMSAGIGYDYLTLIWNRLKKQGKPPSDYVAGASRYAHYNGSSVILRLKSNPNPAPDEFYVMLICIANNPSKSEYRYEGNVIPTNELTEFLPKKYAPKNQGLDPGTEIIVRTPHVWSFTRLVCDNAEFIVKA